MRPRAVAGVEPFAARLKAAPDELIRIFEPADIHIVVPGGETQGTWKMMSGAIKGDRVDRQTAVTVASAVRRARSRSEWSRASPTIATSVPGRMRRNCAVACPVC